MSQPFRVTTSWDDGHILDLRVSERLDYHGLKGTFYISQDYIENRMTEAQIRELSERHEIGAHTLTHPRLPLIDLETARNEIMGSRDWLQSVIGKPVTSFCYPRGEYNQALRDIVEESGFKFARTVEAYHLSTGDDLMATPTSIHIYPFPIRPINSWRTRWEPIQRFLPHMWRLRAPLSALRSWNSLASFLLDKAAQTGGVWHLWGHSWEIERYQMWDELDMILAQVAKYRDAQPVINSQLAD